MSVYPAFTKYLHFAVESEWGTLDGSPAYKLLPFASETIKSTRQNIAAEMFTGQRQRLHSEAVATNVGGNITTSLFAWQDSGGVSLAEHLLKWGTDSPTGWILPSKTVEVADNDVDNKRFLGCRVDRLMLSVAAGQPATISLDVVGREEAGDITRQANVKATQIEALRTMMFAHEMVFESPINTAIAIADFSLTVANQLQPDFLNSSLLTHLTAGERLVDIQFTVRKTADTYDALRRAIGESEGTAKIVLRGLHRGTGNALTDYTTVTLTLNRMAFQDAMIVDQDRNALVSVQPSWAALASDDADDLVLAFGEA